MTTADRIIQRVAELPDRTSPEDWPEAMLVTAEELRVILLDELNEREREALRLIKLACLGTSEKDGWPAQRILGCVTRLCIDGGITEPYHEIASDRRYEALTVLCENRIDYSLHSYIEAA